MAIKLSPTKTLTAAEATALTTHRSSVGTDHSYLAVKPRAHVVGLDITNLAAEASVALGLTAADEFVPIAAIAHMEAVVGGPATGNTAISIGITTPGGTEILGATALTNLINLNDRFVISLAGLTAAVPGDSTIYVTVTTKDTAAGAGTLVDVYLIGHTFLSGT